MRAFLTNIFIRVAPFLVFPNIASAAPRTFYELACEIVKIIDTASLTLIVFGLVVYFWGMATGIPHFGDEKGAEKRKNLFFWGIVALFVMVSIWGIVQILQKSLFGENYLDPSGGGAAC